jgi:hypothetical protein
VSINKIKIYKNMKKRISEIVASSGLTMDQVKPLSLKTVPILSSIFVSEDMFLKENPVIKLGEYLWKEIKHYGKEWLSPSLFYF